MYPVCVCVCVSACVCGECMYVCMCPVIPSKPSVHTCSHHLVLLSVLPFLSSFDTHPISCIANATDIAASAYGRDFLISSQDGRNLVDVLCDVLREMPEKHQGYHCTVQPLP